MSDRNEKKTPVAEISTAEATTEDLGSSFNSKRWLSSFTADKPTPVLQKHGNGGNSMDDGLFVDYDFPMGDMILQPAMEWRRPKVAQYDIVIT